MPIPMPKFRPSLARRVNAFSILRFVAAGLLRDELLRFLEERNTADGADFFGSRTARRSRARIALSRHRIRIG
jgi:hypothetical protein